MKTWLVVLSVIMVTVLLFIVTVNRENTLLKQKALALEISLSSVKNELEKTVDNNLLFEKKIKTVEQNIEAAKIEFNNKIAELEQTKAEKKELVIVESILIGDIKNLEKRLKEDISKVEDKIFDPSEIYEKVKKAVVKIEAEENSGTGFLFWNKSQIITAFHVAGPPGTKVKIFPNDDVHTVILGEVKKINITCDLALIELAVPLNAEPLTAADVKSLKRGTNVLAIGNPSRLPDSVSPGYINGFDRKALTLSSVGMIQIDSAMMPGFSGGPTVNNKGEVIGVISLGMGNFGLVIPIDYVNSLLEKP